MLGVLSKQEPDPDLGVKEMMLDAERCTGVNYIKRRRPWQERAWPGKRTARAV